ncbi:MAG TPA: peptidoglycan-binding domain-containing protein [Solirubrobacteraceae bacterium]|nr:peptidoglycan-binding domain-containing protein [Solirubrobacteraceae bacterium]
MSGEDVRDLQRSLTALGFHTAVRGKFDTLTAKQVRALQRSAKRRATGVVDGGTARFIANVLAAEGTGGIVAQLPDSGGRGGAGQGDSAPADAGPQPLAPGSRARLTSDGLAQAPADAPAEVQAIIAAGNKIAHLPYRYGGGHGSFNDSAYDCSGSVSFGLHGAGLLRSPEDSTGLESFGSDGAGQWVTIYANSGHTFMVVAGLRFDTSGASQTGSRWQRAQRSSSGYTVRHPDGL